jgi:beta-N-acetylhexosaminidase
MKSLVNLILLLILVSCSHKAQVIKKSKKELLIKNIELNNKSEINEDLQQKKWVDSIYNSLSLEEKVGQLFNVAIWTNKDEKHHQEILELIQNEKIGGLIFMQDDVEKQIQLINKFQKTAKVPLLIGMDLEWGLPMRLKNTHYFPYAMTFGAIQNEGSLYLMAKQIALDCKEIGVHWNFAPVVDVNTNPLNPIIGNRSYGSDKYNVVKKAAAYMNGLQENEILSSAKHFPGHGDSSSDSHHDLPSINHSRVRIVETELYPFKELIKQGILGVMVAHLQVPALEKDEKLPSSLSKTVITSLLKDTLNYKGLIITDALNMKGVTKNFPDGETDLLAFEAGNDILLFSQAVKTGKQKILDAIKDGRIPESRIEESVKKILNAKYFVGLSTIKELNSSNIYEKLNSDTHKNLTERIFKEAITVVKNDHDFLPFSENDDSPIFHLPLESQEHSVFTKELNRFKNIKTISNLDIHQLPKNSKIILSVIKDTSTPYKPYTLSNEQLSIVRIISKKFPTILVNFTSPYSLKNVPIEDLKSIIITYQNNEYTQKLTPQLIFGKLKSQGKIPVGVNDKIKFGTGVLLKEK